LRSGRHLAGRACTGVARRDQLGAALNYLRDGDTLIVTRLDGPARSVRDLLTIIERSKARTAASRSTACRLDDTATGKLVVTMLGAIAAFEQEMMLEGQGEGIAEGKAASRPGAAVRR